jgi:hypothetical protein
VGLLEKIFRRPRGGGGSAESLFRTLTAYTPVFRSWDGKLYEAALIRAAIDARARHAAKLSVTINGSARPRLTGALRVRPNALMTWSQYLYRLSTILDMQNTAFIVPVLGGPELEPTGVFPVLPDRCEVLDVGSEAWLRYRFASGQTAAVELSACGIMTKFQYRDDLFGTDNAALGSTMELINLQDQAIAEAVKNSATYRFMARVSNFSKTEDLKKERQRFTRENFSAEAAGNGVLLFPNTYADIKQITSSPYTVKPEEAAEIRQNVYGYFGVNDDVLQNKAVGDAWNAFYEGATEPFAIQASEVHSAMLFSQNERRRGNEFLLTSNRLQFATTADKLKVSAQMADRGIMNRDEIRAIWNLPPLPDGAGQAYTIRGEYYILEADGSRRRAGLEAPENQDTETEAPVLPEPEEVADAREGGEANA